MSLALVPALAAAHFAGPHFGWWVIFPIFWFLLIALLFVLFFRRARRGWGPPPWAYGDRRFGGQGASGDTRGAEQILAERYARGEIEDPEYRARLEVLRAGREAPQS